MGAQILQDDCVEPSMTVPDTAKKYRSEDDYGAMISDKPDGRQGHVMLILSLNSYLKRFAVCGFSMFCGMFCIAEPTNGPLTAARLMEELEGAQWSAAALQERGWGLVPPLTSSSLYEIQGDGQAPHPLMTKYPEQARFEEGRLEFTLNGGKVLLGIGHGGMKLPVDQRPDFGLRFDVEISFDQTGPGETEWTLIPWSAGQRSRLPEIIARCAEDAKRYDRDVDTELQRRVYAYCRRKASGAQHHVLLIENTGDFYRRKTKTSFDGFDLEIKGPEQTGIILHSVRVMQKIRPGGFRREYSIPTGVIWRAVGNVNCKTILFVNGEAVPSASPVGSRPTRYSNAFQEVDLMPYLRPGINVLAVYPAFHESCSANLLASVVMASGEIIELSTDSTWQYVSARSAGWNMPGFTGTVEKIVNCHPKSASSIGVDLSAYRYGYRLAGRIPAYEGRVALIAPDDDQLFFSADKPFSMKARCPAGMAAQQPCLEWLLCQYQDDGQLLPTLDGTAGAFACAGHSIEFMIDGGGKKLSPGVYVFKAVMRGAGGVILEDRIPEAVIVNGKIPMKPTNGLSFEEGLDIEEEALLDLTKPDDPAWPWMEMNQDRLCAEPLIVTRNGLTYRETRPFSSDYVQQVLITYNYAFKHPGDFYLMELEYPDDQPRFFGVNLCSEHDGPGDHSKAGPAIWTGIWHLNSGKLQRLQWLFRPDDGYTSIALINLRNGSSAAASKLRIAHIKGRLPELAAAGNLRRFGIMNESSEFKSGFGKTFRSLKPARDLDSTGPRNLLKGCPLRQRLSNYVSWLDTCSRYAEYQRWAGQNVIFMAFFQYTGGGRINAGPFSPNGDARIVPNFTDVAARVFRYNGIDFYSSIEYMGTEDLIYGCQNKQYSGLSPFRADGQGKELRTHDGGYTFNHPAVRESIISVAKEAVLKFHRLPNFRGVNFVTSFPGGMSPDHFGDDGPGQAGHYNFSRGALDPLRFDYSDATISRFEAEMGIKLPVDFQDKERFQARYQLLTSAAMREMWVDWRTQNLLELFTEMRDQLRAIKPDAQVCLGSVSPGYFADYATAYGHSLKETMRLFGWNYALYNKEPGLCAIPWLYNGSGFSIRYTGDVQHYYHHSENYLKGLRLNADASFIKSGDNLSDRMAMVKYSWLELERQAQKVLPKRDRWQVPYQYTMEASAQGAAARRPFVQAMAATDFNTLLFGFTDANLTMGNEQPLREFIRFLRALPAERFESVPGREGELVVRALHKDGELLFYALNPSPWPVAATMNITPAGPVKDLVTGKTLDAPVTIRIPAYQGSAFAAPGASAIAGWKIQGEGELFQRYQAHMAKQLQRASTWLNTPAIAAALLPENYAVMTGLIGQAQASLQAGWAGEAWQILTTWPFIWHARSLEQRAAAQAMITETDPPLADLQRKQIFAKRAAKPPALDGVLDDDIWREIEPQSQFVDKDGNPALVGTSVRLAWDAAYLYLAFECRDNYPNQVKADAREEKLVTKDDCVVFLLQPDRKQTQHYQMAFNPSGAKFDQQDHDYDFASQWEVAVKRDAGAWVAEAAIPLQDFGGPIESGDQWGVNFCRIFRDPLIPWSSWNYMPQNWHNPRQYGIMLAE